MGPRNSSLNGGSKTTSSVVSVPAGVASVSTGRHSCPPTCDVGSQSFDLTGVVSVGQGAHQISTQHLQEKMVKVGINGFGRIGRLSFRGAWDMPELEIVADPPSSCNQQGKKSTTPARAPSVSPQEEQSTTRTRSSPTLTPLCCQVHVNELKGGARTSAYMLQVPRPSSVLSWTSECP